MLKQRNHSLRLRLEVRLLRREIKRLWFEFHISWNTQQILFLQ